MVTVYSKEGDKRVAIVNNPKHDIFGKEHGSNGSAHHGDKTTLTNGEEMHRQIADLSWLKAQIGLLTTEIG